MDERERQSIEDAITKGHLAEVNRRHQELLRGLAALTQAMDEVTRQHKRAYRSPLDPFWFLERVINKDLGVLEKTVQRIVLAIDRKARRFINEW